MWLIPSLIIQRLTLFILLTMQYIRYLQYITITYATKKIQMLPLLTVQYDNSSCLTILINITYTTITNVTWNKIQLLMLLKTFTPWQKVYFHYCIIQAKLHWGWKLQNQVSEQCSIFHCIWSLVWSSEILGFLEKSYRNRHSVSWEAREDPVCAFGWRSTKLFHQSSWKNLFSRRTHI